MGIVPEQGLLNDVKWVKVHWLMCISFCLLIGCHLIYVIKLLLPLLAHHDGLCCELWLKTNPFSLQLLFSEYFITATEKRN